MNGTFLNYLSHGAIALAITAIFVYTGAGYFAVAPGICYFYGREVGEKAKQRGLMPGPEQPSEWTDLNPFHPRWTSDDRWDLVSAIIGAVLGLGILWL